MMNPEGFSVEQEKIVSEFPPDLAVRVFKQGETAPLDPETRSRWQRETLNNFLRYATQK